MTDPTEIAALYARQSHGKDRSIAEQIEDGRKACASNDWPIRDIYTDKVSASRFARGDRPDWKRLIADLEAGRFNVLVMWESSRGDRDPETWFGLLRRCREHKVRIHVVNHGRTYDMSHHRDWRTLAEDGVDNAYESERTSNRLGRTMAANAIQGRPHGQVNYGYERIYDPRTRALIRQQPHPEQAPVVREIITSISRGVSIKAVTDGLNERGILSAEGGKWGRAIVRNIALNPVYIGKRRWKGELYDGTWPALVDEAIFWRAGRVLTDPARKTTRPARASHLLSYLCNCGVCDAPMNAYRRRQDMYYACSADGCVYVKEEFLNLHVSALLFGLMKTEEFRAAIAAASNDDADVLSARAEADELRQRLDEHAKLSAEGSITPRSFAIIEAELGPKIEAAERRAARSAMPVQLADLITAEDVLDTWLTMSIAAQRETIRVLFEEIKILPAIPGKRAFNPDRVKHRWAWGTSDTVTG